MSRTPRPDGVAGAATPRDVEHGPPPRTGNADRFPGTASFPWLSPQKITIPDRVPGYVHRAELVSRAMPDQRRLTVLQAAAGFGKTTLLAECARRLRGQGVAVAYVSLDEHETPASLDASLAFACDSAGTTVEMPDTGETPIAGAPRLAAVARSIQSHGRPFCIAVDGLELLAQPAAIATLEFLLHRGPPNLHLALAGREMPNGLNMGSALLEGRAEIIGTEELRFSRPETARFFGLRLSRRALSREIDRTAGWPFALRLGVAGVGDRREWRSGAADVAGNWIESRLFAQLAARDRELVLDLGLFAWFDERLLDEVLGPASRMSLRAMPALEGLLERTTAGTSERWQLHALVRDHCAARRLREDPGRFALVHRRIARALADRGETVAAMRHAARGSDPVLAGDILLRAGGVRLWLRQGVAQYEDAARLLTTEAVAGSARLKLVRCAALVLSGRPAEAQDVHAEASRSGPAGEDLEYAADDCIVRAAMAIYGGDPAGSVRLREALSDSARIARSPRLDAATRGYFEYGRCVLHFLRGEFDPALERLARARELAPGNPYIAFYGGVLRGQIDFLGGRVEDAESSYGDARRIARKYFMQDPVAATACNVALAELEVECDRSPGVVQPGVRQALTTRGVPFSYFATAVNVFVDRQWRAGRAEDAVPTMDDLLGRARASGQAAFARLLAARQASLLVVAGRVDDAESLWRREGLPERTASCVEPGTQGMRELEAVAEARARMLVAAKRYEEARGLLCALGTAAAARSWRRTQMRALALSVLLEHRAGDSAACVRRLTTYLGLFRKAPYAWPLLREGAACVDALGTFLRLSADSPLCPAGRGLLAAAHARQGTPELSLSEREREILGQLPGQLIKQVAADLGLSVHGVRYHLRKLFSKFDVSTRAELLRRAEDAGLISRP